MQLRPPHTAMQRPTCTNFRIRSPKDALTIFHAVSLNLLPMVSRRLDAEERRGILPGHVFVWEERGSSTETSGVGLERWTDSKRWGPSRVKDEFLFYHEKEPEQPDGEQGSDHDSDTTLPSHSGAFRECLIKQTYSVFVEKSNRGRRKWHLIAYFTQESLDRLHTIDDFPVLGNLYVPPGKYKSARSANRRRDASFTHSTVYPDGPLLTQSLPVPYNQEPRKLLTGSELAPLTYLQNLTPPRRHAFDEEVLMSFTLGLA